MARILVIDDEPSICWGLAELGKRMGHEVAAAPTAERGLELARDWQPKLVLLDVRLPGMDGLTAMPLLREAAPAADVVVITAHGDLSTAVEAVRQGALDYIAKPFDLAQIEGLIQRALARPAAASAPAQFDSSADGLVGRTPLMQEVFKRIALVASAEACVMLAGESGTGKELVARAIHRYSRRADGPFVAVNVAALNLALAESELFGHIRGAFTGADSPRTGLLALADGGTLFLDEVADIPLPVQVKLLRALEQGEVMPVGTGQTLPTNFRLITATHQDLAAKSRCGEFRHDLYYRLSTFQIDLPPLRQRRDDIPALVDFFIRQLLTDDAGGPPRVSQEALQEMQSRDWHGNVRELRNAIEHALILHRGGVILAEHLPPPLAPLQEAARASEATPAAAAASERLRATIEQWMQGRLKSDAPTAALYDEFLALVEPPFLDAALRKYHGQCAAAARVMGIHRTTLKKKLAQYGIASEDEQ